MNTQNNAQTKPAPANSASQFNVTQLAQMTEQGQPKVEPKPEAGSTSKN
jgi:hypothetical protein